MVSAVYRTKTYTVAPSGSVNEQLPLIAVRVRVDNPGGMWVNIVDAAVTVPPFTIGLIIAVPAIQIANITTTPPAGQTPLVSASSQPATVIYSDDVNWVPTSGTSNAALQNNFSTTALTVCPAFGTQVVTLSFPANTVLVNNPGGQWVTITSGNTSYTVAPWTVGVVIPLQVASTSVTVSTVPPTGQVNTGQGNCSTVSFSEQMLPANTGQSIGIPTNAYASHLETIAGGLADNNPGVTLGFTANSVIVDNRGAQWVSIFDGNQFRTVPPYVFGAVIPCAHGVTTARFLSNAPSGGQVNRSAGSIALAMWTEQVLQASPGSPMENLGSNYATGTISLAGGQGDNNPGVALGFTANSIVVDNNGGQWLDIYDGHVFRRVGPWTISMVIVCPTGITNARFLSNLPPAGQVNTGAGEIALLTYTEQVLPSTPGTQLAPVIHIAQTGTAVQNFSGTFPSVAASTFAFNITLPVGTWYLLQIKAGTQSMNVPGSASRIVVGTANGGAGSSIFFMEDGGDPGVGLRIYAKFNKEMKIIADGSTTQMQVTVANTFGANYTANTMYAYCDFILSPVYT